MDYWAHYFSETTNSYQHVTTILIPLSGHLSDKKRMCMSPPPTPPKEHCYNSHENTSMHSLQVCLELELQAEYCGLPI